jgi:xanthine/uracil permease
VRIKVGSINRRVIVVSASSLTNDEPARAILPVTWAVKMPNKIMKFLGIADFSRMATLPWVNVLIPFRFSLSFDFVTFIGFAVIYADG